MNRIKTEVISGKKTGTDIYKEKYPNFSVLFAAICCIMVMFHISANVMSVKIVSFGQSLLFDAGTLTFPFTFVLGDALTEIWGYKTSKKVIYISFVCNILFVLFTSLGAIIPATDGNLEMSNAYSMVFSYVPRLVTASLLAFLTGELANAYIMHRLKLLTKSRYLWFRAIGSSVIGYILDTFVFVFAGFAGTIAFSDMAEMMLKQYFFKLGIDIFPGTPIVYFVVWLFRREQSKRTRDI